MDVLVVVETIDEEIADIAFEMLGKARGLADATGGNVVAVVFGHANFPLLGASDRVIQVEDGKDLEFYKKAILEVMERIDPKITLIGNTAFGTDLAGQIAAELNLPLISFCVGLRIENGELLATSMAYGGKVLIDLVVSKGIFIVNKGSFPKEAGEVSGNPKVEKLTLDIELNGIEFLEYIKPEVEDVDISKEEIVIGIGRGVQDESNIDIAKELAEVLGGVIAASRPIVDQGWLPITRQVGRSGKTIYPKLYLALGISGASEHLEGVKAKNVIAINTDPDAPIFRVSRYGAIIDMFELLPILVERIKKVKG
jgi:electron transfer flavoprotein alpha subunit